LIQQGSIRIDGKPVLASHVEVRVGQTITMIVHAKIRAIRVVRLPVRRGPAAEAQSCYEEMMMPEPIDVSYR